MKKAFLAALIFFSFSQAQASGIEPQETRGTLYGWGIRYNMQIPDEKALADSIYAVSIKGFDLIKTDNMDPAALSLMLGFSDGCRKNSESKCSASYATKNWRIPFSQQKMIDWHYFSANFLTKIYPDFDPEKTTAAILGLFDENTFVLKPKI